MRGARYWSGALIDAIVGRFSTVLILRRSRSDRLEGWATRQIAGNRRRGTQLVADQRAKATSPESRRGPWGRSSG